MVFRPHLPLVPANGLRGRVRRPSIRVLGVVAIAAVALVALYAAARFTSLFVVEKVEVTGGRPAVRQAVQEAAKPLLGKSLVGLDEGELRRRVETIPAVHDFRLDRAFPHTLRITVVQERPLAVVQNGMDAWLVSERGRVLRALDPDSSGKRPVVWAGIDSSLATGGTVQAANVKDALQALRLLPTSFPGRVRSARADERGVIFVLANGMELRLGDADALALKLAVARRVLRRLGPEEAGELAYLDVSIPERAVAGATLNSQLEG